MPGLNRQQIQDGAAYRGQVANDVKVQAPVGGWNTRESFDDVPPTDALIMDNWLPALGSVKVRNGRTVHVQTAITGNVETLAILEAANFNKMIAANGGTIYDVTTVSIPLGGGFTNDIWHWTNFDAYLILVNGFDTPQEYDGTTLKALSPALVGPNNPIGCHPFKNRMYYWDSNSQEVWYTALFARAGTCTKFDLSQLTKFGGNLIRVETWTHDGGTGPDDHIVFIMSSGEVIVFQGTSPASIADWALVGVYYIGSPLGIECAVKYGGDLIIMSELDIVNLSSIIQGPEALAKRSKITGALQDVTEFIGSPFFNSIMYPRKKLALFNVPAPGGEESYQFAQNLITGSWSRVKGWTIYSWVVFDGVLYIGCSSGTIYKAFDGNYDETMTGAVKDIYPIQSELQTAWLTFGGDMNKTFHAVKPYVKTSGTQNITIRTAVDFGVIPSFDFPTAVASPGTPWGSPWGSPWGPALSVNQSWRIVTGYGRVVSALWKMTTNQRTAWAASMWHIEAGTAM